MLACKGIFARPSMPQPRASAGRRQPQRLASARLPVAIIPHPIFQVKGKQCFFPVVPKFHILHFS